MARLLLCPHECPHGERFGRCLLPPIQGLHDRRTKVAPVAKEPPGTQDGSSTQYRNGGWGRRDRSKSLNAPDGDAVTWA